MPDVVDDMSASPQSLRQEAAHLRDQAEIAYLFARDSGSLPDRQEILSLNQQAKSLDQQALAMEDQSYTKLSDKPGSDVSQTQIDLWAAEALISKVEDGIYLSGYDAVKDDDCLVDRGVTHILSICQYYLPSGEQSKRFVCKSLPALDTFDQNLLQYVPECIAFIDTARQENGTVLVHCHAGQSRSVTILAAYLMQRDKSSVLAALDRIERVRRVQPNENFMNQLRIYNACDYNIANDSVVYRRWKFESMFQALPIDNADGPVSMTANGPTTYQETDSSSRYTQIRCKKCRFVLASENHIIQHEPKIQNVAQPESQQSSLIPPSCAHFFLEPIRWMKTELDRGEVDGRFSCPNPKCGAKIGSYAWQGMTCSCRRWVLPALCIQRSKVDELKSRTPAKVTPARKKG